MPMGFIICWSAHNFWPGVFVGLLDQPLFQISSSANLFRVLNYISSSSCKDGVKPSQCLPTYNKSLNNQSQKERLYQISSLDTLKKLEERGKGKGKRERKKEDGKITFYGIAKLAVWPCGIARTIQINFPTIGNNFM